MSEAVWRTSAPAKVNLGLRVSTRRADGYHELRSVFLRLDLADDLTLGPTAAPDRIEIEGDADCPVEGNLALAAVRGFRHEAVDVVGPVALTLRKRIPMAAGLAGGSSDAAAALRILARRHPGAVGEMRLQRLARSLGADVPFFCSAVGAALVSGIGDRIEPLPPPIEPLGVVLVRPATGLSTGRVFGAWDELDASGGTVSPVSPDVVDDLAAELRAGAPPATIVGLAPRLRDANDLWSAAVQLEPRMERHRSTLEHHLARPVSMTGSGSTLVALYLDPGGAVDAARHLARHLPPGLDGAWVAAAASGTPYPPDIVIEEERA